jgi:aryl-alcohol dehydrogenase-like predicted oxidoreductase
VVEVLREIANRYEVSPGEVAIAWTLRNPAVTAAIVGVRTAQQVSGIIGAADSRVGALEAKQIELALREELAIA